MIKLERIKYEKRSSIKAFNIQVREFNSYGKIKIKDLIIEYFEVDHKPVKYAYGFNFYNNNKKLTIENEIMKNKLELREREIETLTTKYNNTNEEKDTLDKDSCRITVGGSGPGLALADSGWVERGEGGASDFSI